MTSRPAAPSLYYHGQDATLRVRIRSHAGLPRTGKQAGVWKVPDALVMLLVLLVTLLPFSVYLFHEIPDS